MLTWIRYGKPDVSMCLNASLAGLVAITAPWDVTDASGSIAIGAVAGLLVIFGVWLLDYKLHVDDPVGAVAVHMMNGIWGTIATGLFATASAPGFELAGIKEGLFYGGGFEQLGIQLVGFASVAAWAAIGMLIVFGIIKVIFGLRVSEEEELEGLDLTEHGLASAYSGFSIMDVSAGGMVHGPLSGGSGHYFRIRNPTGAARVRWGFWRAFRKNRRILRPIPENKNPKPIDTTCFRFWS